MTDRLLDLVEDVLVLLTDDLQPDTLQATGVLLTSLVTVLRERLVAVEVSCHDADGRGYLYAHRGVPGVVSSLEPIARLQ